MKKILPRLIFSYIVTFAIYNIGGFEPTDILLGVVFFAVFMLSGGLSCFAKMQEYVLDPGVKKTARIVSFFWTILYVIYMGGRINRDLDNPLFSGIYTVLTVTGLYIVLCHSIRIILALIAKSEPATILYPDDRKEAEKLPDAGIVKESVKSVADGERSGFPWKIWLIYTGLIFVCMLPLFLLNFPGTMTVDSFDQLAQARGLAPYSDHHPWVHTLVIQAFYSIGYKITGNVYAGIATYTLMQMLIMAMSTAYAIAALSESGLGKKGRILMFLSFVIYPYNLAYAITMWKDVLFAASVLVLTVTIYRVFVSNDLTGATGRVGVRDIILLVISGIFMCLLRHNGFYAYILTFAVILIYELITARKQTAVGNAQDKDADIQKKSDPYKGRIALYVVAVIFTLAVSALVRGPVERVCNVEAGDFAHNIPIPLQQIGRVVYDRCKLTDEERASIERINTLSFVCEEYTPGGADPMMQWVMYGDSDYLLAHKAEYISLWIRLGLKHPEEYIRAYIDQTKGYYTTMSPEQTEYYGILANADGLEPQPIAGAGVRIKINEILSKLHEVLPVYGILYSMGACFMLLILGTCIIGLQGKKERILTYLPVLTLTLTLLVATPLCADLRYAYPLMLSMPTLICITLRKV